MGGSGGRVGRRRRGTYGSTARTRRRRDRDRSLAGAPRVRERTGARRGFDARGARWARDRARGLGAGVPSGLPRRDPRLRARVEGGGKNPRLLPRRNKQSRARGDWNGRRDALGRPVPARAGASRASRRGSVRARTFAMMALRCSAYALMAARSPPTGTSRSLVASRSARNCFCCSRKTSFTMSPPSAYERVAPALNAGAARRASWRATRAVARRSIED